jgi:hypothetical protein
MDTPGWFDAVPPATLHLECGTEVPHAVGTRVFDFYDRKPAVITRVATSPDAPTMPCHARDGGAAWWVTVRFDDGGGSLLDQSRMCSIAYAQSRGWLPATDVEG